MCEISLKGGRSGGPILSLGHLVVNTDTEML